MISLLVLLCLLSLLSVVGSVLVIFQQWEDGQHQDKLRDAVLQVLNHLNQQAIQQAEQEEMIGKTWLPTSGDQARVEQLLQKQATGRQYSRTGSDPFSLSSKLAP